MEPSLAPLCPILSRATRLHNSSQRPSSFQPPHPGIQPHRTSRHSLHPVLSTRVYAFLFSQLEIHFALIPASLWPTCIGWNDSISSSFASPRLLFASMQDTCDCVMAGGLTTMVGQAMMPISSNASYTRGFPERSADKESTCRRPRLGSWVKNVHWRRDRPPTPVFLGFPGSSGG